MKKQIIHSIIIVSTLLFFIQGCVTSSYITSKKGTIKIGMTKAEVLGIWGEPEHKVPPEEKTSAAYNENRYEFWEYPPIGWLGNEVLVTFDINGIVTDIEVLYK